MELGTYYVEKRDIFLNGEGEVIYHYKWNTVGDESKSIMARAMLIPPHDLYPDYLSLQPDRPKKLPDRPDLPPVFIMII